MGITWKFTMPLLSTLAALVIIVHSAEEDVDRDYRYDLRSKAVDTGPSDYGQEWRMAEPIMQEPAAVETWNDDMQEVSPVRRRAGRKRKRRPPADQIEEIAPININEDTPIQHEFPTKDNSELPRRRRKKIRPNRWTDEHGDENVPIRRRLQRRRKRPSLDYWPTLSEFGGITKESESDKYPEIILDDNEEDGIDKDNVKNKKYDEEDEEYIDREIKVHHISRPKSKLPLLEEDDSTMPSILMKEDKSLSEFSMEVLNSNEKKKEDSQGVHNIHLHNKVKEKSPIIFYHTDSAQDHEPINPQTLKDILKRSNGTSLSEILQQHNLTLEDLLSGKENAITVLQSQNLLQTTKNVTDSISVESNNGKHFKSKNTNKATIPVLRKNIKSTLENNEHQFYSDHSEINSQNLLAAIPKKDLQTESNKQHKSKNSNKAIYPDPRKPKVKNNDDQFLGEHSEIKNKNSTVMISKNDFPPMEEEKSNANAEIYSTQNINKGNNSNSTVSISERKDHQNISTNSDSTIPAKRRFSGGIRRKLRMRPMLSNTYKSQLNRDLIALSARRYMHNNRRNGTKAKEWRDMLPLMPNLNMSSDIKVINEDITLTTTLAPEETTIFVDIDDLEQSTITDVTQRENDIHDQTVTTNTEEVETTTLMLEILESEMPSSITEKPIVKPVIMAENGSGLRRQAYNNRLKRKRLKHKTSTTEPVSVMKNFLNMGDYVSSSEFIARTQLPKLTTPMNARETATELEDFMTTEITSQSNIDTKSKRPNIHKLVSKLNTLPDYPITLTTTEETAKIEIEEILNDTSTSAKLSKILRDRNMTLGELVEHRERGSSHVHLADIFHNASREPNPPEPFLTKSSLEPISKETYPLRALLEANSHDTTTRSTTTELNTSPVNHITIPMTMGFGNNVNENAENMGIMSLFNKITIDTDKMQTTLQKDSEGTPYKSTIIHVNTTDDENDTRESRMMSDDQDMVSWNEIFAMIRKQRKNESSELEKSDEGVQLLTTDTVLETNADGSKLIALEHLHNFSETDSNIASGSLENVEFNTYESGEVSHDQNIPDNLPSSAKSVTVATTSLVGLAMVLFLLTYTVLKWRQQKALSRKNNFNDERIPTPVFENRKIKKNCSSRSISPMLPISNIYTMNTLESHNGKDSPEYMWDTLRKPFQ